MKERRGGPRASSVAASSRDHLRALAARSRVVKRLRSEQLSKYCAVPWNAAVLHLSFKLRRYSYDAYDT